MFQFSEKPFDTNPGVDRLSKIDGRFMGFKPFSGITKAINSKLSIMNRHARNLTLKKINIF
jgi:hypothetical protein